jgi:hypothetical protein
MSLIKKTTTTTTNVVDNEKDWGSHEELNTLLLKGRM